MVNQLMSETNLRLLLPETLWIEPEHYQQASELSNELNSEKQQWQAYLTILGKLAFSDWLRERLPGHPIRNSSDEIAEINALSIGDFKLYLIAVEHVLDEVVQIPKVAIEQPELVAHFYVVLEILEDQEQIVTRGFLRHDELVEFNDPVTNFQTDKDCQIPLAAFDAEINHLVFYVQQVEPSAILRPAASPQITNTSAPIELSTIKTRLSQWLQGALDEGWQTIDSLISPEANLAWSTRHTALNAKGGKLINFGLQLANQAVVLLITVTPESEDRIGVGAQALPAGGAQVLPPQLKLTLLSAKDNNILQEVESREQDNYIQLKPFKGRSGTSFSIEVSLNDIRVTEVFEL